MLLPYPSRMPKANMKNALVALLVVGFSSTTSLPAQQQGAPASCVWIEAVNAVTGNPITEAYAVLLPSGSQSPEIAVTNAAGRAPFLNLVPQPNDQGQEVVTEILAEVDAAGYLPYKRVVEVSAVRRIASCRLVPNSTGFVTPLVSSADGGVFVLPGLGTLTVPASVLAQDAVIKLIPIPDFSASQGILPDILRYQIWAQAQDELGQLLPGVLPSQHAGITLGVTLPSLAPVDAINEVWTSHSLGVDFSQNLSQASSFTDDRVVDISICDGHNAATQTYSVPVTAGCGDLWRPWETTKTVESVSKVVVGSVGFKCGHYMASKTFGQNKSITHTTSVSLSVANCSEVGFEQGAPLSKLTGKMSTTVTGTVGSTTATTTTFEQTTSVNATNPVSGVPGVQPVGWGCVSGTVEFGYLHTTYRFIATRKKVCIGGYVLQTKDLGTIEVSGLFDQWFTGVAWDSSCPGCAGTGSVPSDMRVY